MGDPVTVEALAGGFFKGPRWVVHCTICGFSETHKGEDLAIKSCLNHMKRYPHFHVSVARDNKAGNVKEEYPFPDLSRAQARAEILAQEYGGSPVAYSGMELQTGMSIYQIQKKQGKITMLVTAHGCLRCS